MCAPPRVSSTTPTTSAHITSRLLLTTRAAEHQLLREVMSEPATYMVITVRSLPTQNAVVSGSRTPQRLNPRLQNAHISLCAEHDMVSSWAQHAQHGVDKATDASHARPNSAGCLESTQAQDTGQPVLNDSSNHVPSIVDVRTRREEHPISNHSHPSSRVSQASRPGSLGSSTSSDLSVQRATKVSMFRMLTLLPRITCVYIQCLRVYDTAAIRCSESNCA